MKKKRRRGLPLIAKKAEQAMTAAVAELIQERHRRGEPIVVWRKGRVVKVHV